MKQPPKKTAKPKPRSEQRKEVKPKLKLNETVLERITRSPEYRKDGKLVSDPQQRGLYLRIGKRDGPCSWVLIDQRGTNPKSHSGAVMHTRTFGQWPRMSLAKARAEAQRLRLEDRGIGLTWETAATRYVAERGKRLQPIAKRNLERSLLTHLGALGPTKLDGLKRERVAAIVQELFGAAPETAIKVLAQAKALTRWAATTGLVENDPLHLLDKSMFGNFRSQPKTRVASDDEIRAMFADETPTGLALRWQLLTGCRIAEALQFEPAQVTDGIWTIPALATKSQRAHRVPLSKAAAKLVKEMPPSISYSGVAQHMQKTYGDLRSHDARRSAATRARQLGASAETVHYVLNHARGVLDKTYLQHSMTDEARAALEKLAAHYQTILRQGAKATKRG